MSLADLSVAKKINHEKLINGKLTYNQLKSISDYFGYSPIFFLQPELPSDEAIQTPAFRSLSNQSIGISLQLGKIIRQTELHRDLYLDLMEELNEEIPSFKFPETLGSIDNQAETIREWLGLNSSSELNFDIYRKKIESKGILVFQSMGYKGKWQLKDSSVIGFSIQHPLTPIIFVKKTSPQMQTFTLFHELGHLLLHQNSCIDDEANLHYDFTSQIEGEANRFAAKCLLPKSLMPTSCGVEPKHYDEEFSKLARQLGISVEVIVVSLLQSGLINQPEYKVYQELKQQERELRLQDHPEPQENQGFRGYRFREPIHIFGNSYVSTVFNAYYSGIATLSKTSKYLDGLKVEDIKKLQEVF